MATFIRDAGNYILHFVFMYVLIATGLAMVLMFLFLAIGLTIQTVFGIEEISASPTILGGIGVGISVAFIVAGIISLIKGIRGDWDSKIKPEDVVGPGKEE